MKKKAAKIVLIIILLFFVTIIFLIGVGLYFINKKYPLMGDAIAILELNGPIYSSKDKIEKLHEYRDNSSVRAIILRIDSPGGTVGAAQELYREIRKVREKNKKKVIASMSDLAASGGYYIACASDYIFANPGSLTGSIGVIMNFTNWQVLTDKIGLKFEVIKSSKYKDIGSPHRPMTEEEKGLLKEVIDGVYKQFVDAVLATREGKIKDKWEVALVAKDVRDKEKIESEFNDYVKNQIADGRILNGQQAYDLGLVDELGNLDDAIDYAKKITGIKGKPRIIKERKKPVGLFDFLSGKFEGVLKDIKPTNDVSLEYMLKFY